ncbi:GAF and ANTAR domain-containing protein [Lentzea chajnantorensis]
MDERRRHRLSRLVAECGAAGAALGRSLCAALPSQLPGVDGAALVLHGSDRAEELVGASDPWAAGLAEEQFTLGEGPVPAAIGAGEPVLAGDLAAESARWPAFTAAARAGGLAAVFVFPLRADTAVLGTLALYSRRAGDLSEDAAADAAVLADLVTRALLAQHERMDDEERLRVDLAYQEVNMASGMLAVQLGVSLEEALVRLRAHAFATGRSVRELAKDVLARRIPLNRLAD